MVDTELFERDLAPSPIAQFERWYRDALAANAVAPDAMTLASATKDGVPSARMVLLKGADERGFVFFSNYEGQKARELAENPKAALVFYWPELHRQVRVTGPVTRVGAEESGAYFRTRARGSQIGAWSSPQSRAIPNREALESLVADVEARFAGQELPLPPHWGGFRVAPESIEFWQGRPDRLHDRLRYTREADGSWRIERLAP
jgi:pyridoxamine 5'-phosphate oxidase